METDPVREAEWRMANQAASKCEEIARIYQQHAGCGAAIAITALEAAASAIRRMADESLNSGRPSDKAQPVLPA
ncbi:hypothetical protein [Belnapia rosea]|uniref:hypothetical protein n=1 Tax=Belnapia rosea TaxID=938405 RepID=UPI00088385D4|nr:hypothetical protein [Belnapia rosea]SDB74125.1 hypothetical protein SAMN02927895_05048 [Belnapia rosea]